MIALVGDRSTIRNGETNLGDLLADMVREGTGTKIAMVNSGSIRMSVEPGEISLRTVYNVYPFLNYLCVMEVTGDEILREMEYSLGLLGLTSGGFIQFSGMAVTYDPDAEAGSRVISISVGGEDLDHGATYTLTITDFMWTGGDGNLVFVGHECETFGTMDEVVIEAFEDIGVVDASTIEGGRLVAVRRGRPRPAKLHARSRTSSTEDRPTVTS